MKMTKIINISRFKGRKALLKSETWSIFLKIIDIKKIVEIRFNTPKKLKVSYRKTTKINENNNKMLSEQVLKQIYNAKDQEEQTGNISPTKWDNTNKKCATCNKQRWRSMRQDNRGAKKEICIFPFRFISHMNTIITCKSMAEVFQMNCSIAYNSFA